MGETDIRKSDINSDKVERKSGTDKNGSSGNINTDATGTGTGTGTGSSGTGSSGTGNSKRIKAVKNSKVSVLTDLPEVNIPEPQETKPKRTYTKRAKKEEEKTSFDSKQISAFIVAVSSMVASREGMAHWIITETEAEQIAKPLSNMIAKSESLKGLGEHADAFALVTACIMIFAPRLIITLQTNKTKKGIKKNVTGTDSGTNNGSKSTDSVKQVSRKNANTPSNDGTSLFESISPIQ